MLNGKNVLITGGTGSFGKKFVRSCSSTTSRERLIISAATSSAVRDVQRFNVKKYPCIRYFLGDVRDRDRLTRAFQGVDYVIHAAALKQVPAAEYNPAEFIRRTSWAP